MRNALYIRMLSVKKKKRNDRSSQCCNAEDGQKGETMKQVEKRNGSLSMRKKEYTTNSAIIIASTAITITTTITITLYLLSTTITTHLLLFLMLVVQENRVSRGFQSNINKKKKKHTQRRIVCVTVWYVHATHPEVHTCARVPHSLAVTHKHIHTHCSIESIEIIFDARVHVALRMCMFFFHMCGCWHRRDFTWREYIT